jgi:hypothetical protein
LAREKKLFWRKKSLAEETKAKADKLPGPKLIPEPVRNYLVTQFDKAPALLAGFKSVIRKSTRAESTFDIRLFDETEAKVEDIVVKDYTSLDQFPELIFFEGWFNRKSRQVELHEKRDLKAKPEVPILGEGEIKQRIEGLTRPGSTVLFYLGESSVYGGPLSRGVAIVSLNPNYPVENQKKYIVYIANVDGLEPVGKRQAVFDTDRPKDVVRWIKERHHKPSNY